MPERVSDPYRLPDQPGGRARISAIGVSDEQFSERLMKTLILMRHAKSGWDGPNLSDHDRTLAPRGQRDAPLMGAWLKARGYLADVALVSDAHRTRETWALLDLPTPVSFHADLYLADPDQMMALIIKASADKVMVLGHNPGLGDLSTALAAEWPSTPVSVQFPTASVCIMTFDVTSWNDVTDATGTVLELKTPRDLRNKRHG